MNIYAIIVFKSDHWFQRDSNISEGHVFDRSNLFKLIFGEHYSEVWPQLVNTGFPQKFKK